MADEYNTCDTEMNPQHGVAPSSRTSSSDTPPTIHQTDIQTNSQDTNNRPINQDSTPKNMTQQCDNPFSTQDKIYLDKKHGGIVHMNPERCWSEPTPTKYVEPRLVRVDSTDDNALQPPHTFLASQHSNQQPNQPIPLPYDENSTTRTTQSHITNSVVDHQNSAWNQDLAYLTQPTPFSIQANSLPLSRIESQQDSQMTKDSSTIQISPVSSPSDDDSLVSKKKKFKKKFSTKLSIQIPASKKSENDNSFQERNLIITEQGIEQFDSSPLVPTPADGPSSPWEQIQANHRAYIAKQFSSLQASASNIRFEDLKFIQVLGRGASAQVQLVEDSKTGKRYAMKSISLADRDRISTAMIHNEIEALVLTKDSRHIVNLVQAFFARGCIHLLLEYVDHSSLEQLLQQRKQLPEYVLSVVANQLVTALEHLHAKKLVHLDIKPANVLISKSGQIYISDFGTMIKQKKLSDPRELERALELGTIFYWSPERAHGQNFDFRADVWEMALTLFVLRVGQHPLEHFTFSSLFELREIIDKLDIPALLKSYSDKISDVFADFLAKCLEKDPNNRATAAELKNHPFLKQSLAWSQSAGEDRVRNYLEIQEYDIHESRSAHSSYHHSQQFQYDEEPSSDQSTRIEKYWLEEFVADNPHASVSIGGGQDVPSNSIQFSSTGHRSSKADAFFDMDEVEEVRDIIESPEPYIRKRSSHHRKKPRSGNKGKHQRSKSASSINSSWETHNVPQHSSSYVRASLNDESPSSGSPGARSARYAPSSVDASEDDDFELADFPDLSPIYGVESPTNMTPSKKGLLTPTPSKRSKRRKAKESAMMTRSPAYTKIYNFCKEHIARGDFHSKKTRDNYVKLLQKVRDTDERAALESNIRQWMELSQ